VVLSTKEMCVLTVKHAEFDFSILPIASSAQEPVCGMAIIADYKNQYFQDLDAQLAGQRHLFLTGHKDGTVLLWRSDAYIGVLEQYEHEITCMTKCFEGLAICTWAGQVNLWDVHLTKCTKRIELGNLPFKMVNFNITSIDYNQKRLLILTDSGDAIEISLNE
jgi:hypothetical protein